MKLTPNFRPSHFSLQIITIAGFPYKKSISSFLRFIWSFFPPNLLAKAVNLLSDATSTPEALGISWKGRSKCPPDTDDCVMTIVCNRFAHPEY